MLTFLIVVLLVTSASLATNTTDGNLTTTTDATAGNFTATAANLTSSSIVQQPVTTYPVVIPFPPGIQPAEETTSESSIPATTQITAASTRRLPIIVIITSNDEIRSNKNPCPLESPCEQLEVQSLTVNEPWEGCLFSADTVILDGILTIDIPLDTLMSNPSLCLFDTPNPPGGYFNELNIPGVPSCVDATSDYQEHGYTLNFDDLSCTSASAGILKLVF